MANKAVLIDVLWAGLRDNDGNPLNGGYVYTYIAGTTTPKATYTDANKTTEATNPIQLDAYGRATVYGDGLYKFKVTYPDGVEIITVDNVDYTYATSIDQDWSQIYGVDSGSANTYVVTLTPSITTYTDGMPVLFKANASNTGISTLNVNGIGAVPIYKDKSTELEADDILASQLVLVVYDTSQSAFQMISTPSKDVSYSEAVAIAESYASSGIFPKFLVHKNGSNQSIPGSAITKITWNAETRDTNNNFDLTNNQFKPTVAGDYYLHAHLTATAAYAVENKIYVYKNGAAIKEVHKTNTKTQDFDIITEVNANGSTDYFEIYFWHAGSSWVIDGDSTKTWFEGNRLN